MPSLIRCLVVGDAGVGKTELLFTYTKRGLPTVYVPTVFNNDLVTVMINGESVSLGLYDSSGKENFPRFVLLSLFTCY